jgi:hypothetical protein
MLDTNAVDVLSATDGLSEALRPLVEAGELDILWTHITIDELLDITHDAELRNRLVNTGAQLARVVDTVGFVLGVSRLGMATLGPAEPIADYRGDSSSDNNLKDALIVIAAQHGADAVVTNDTRMIPRCRARGMRVIDPADVLGAYRDAAGP